MDAIIAAAKSYHGKPLDEKAQAAEHLRRQVLGTFNAADIGAVLARESAPMDAVRALLLGTRAGLVAGELAGDASRAAALRLAVYQQALALLSAGGARELGEDEAGRLAEALAAELGSMISPVDLSEVVDVALDVFESGCPHACAPLELLPRALLLLGAMGGHVDLPADGGASTACQVSDYCQGVVRRVCENDWPLRSIARVLLALREFPLTPETLVQAVQKGVARARQADVHDLPSIVHQLLLLAGRGCRDAVLLEVVRLFEHREAALAASAAGGAVLARRQLLEVEGSVLLAMDMAAKHDAELGQAWVRYLRSDAPRISPFMLAVSFMLAAIQRFEQPVNDALKGLILGALKDAATLAASPWLPVPRPVAPAGAAGGGDAGSTTAGQPPSVGPTGPSYASLREALLQCVRNSAAGQGGIVQPMAGLAVALMGAGAGEKGASYAPDGSLDPAGAPPAALAADLGMHMLLELFRGQREFRRDVVALCHNHLIGAKEEEAAPFVRLIALLVRQEPSTVAEYMNDFKVSLENLAFLPPNAALSLLLAVWPLCHARRDVQDYVVMLLRKAMFSRELHARLLAARGFLYMIIEALNHSGGAGGGGSSHLDGPGSSASQMSQMSALSGGSGGGTLLHELMSFLRRCLSQQPEVRRALYEGMAALLTADPSAQECVVEPLLPHFCQFYEVDEQLTPPLKLEACARLQGEAVRLVEPLQHLLAGLRRVLRVTQPPPGATEPGNNFAWGTDLSDLGGEEPGAVAEALRQHFRCLRGRLVNCTLEDFLIDQGTEYNAAEPAGELNHALGDVLLGCMEVMMEDLVDEIAGAGPSGSTEQLGQDLLALFQQHQRLLDLAAAGKGGAKGKAKPEGLTQAVGGRKGAGRPPAAAKAAAAGGGGAGGVVTLDKRVPALSIGCLCKLLDAIVDDGLVGGGGGADGAGAATMSAHLKLARDTQFQTFVLSATLRALQAAAASDTAAAIATGTAGSGEDAEEVRALLAVAPWQELAGPLLRAVQTVVLSCAGQRVVPAEGVKREKDPTEPLTQAALRALEQLLAMGRSAAGVAALLREAPALDADLQRGADLPPAQGLPEPQLTIVRQLPHFKQLLDVLVEHGCGKELEPLCAALAQLAALVPAGEAAAVGRWAVAACQEQQAIAHVGAAKALVSLALRSAALSGRDVLQAGTAAAAGPAADLKLLRSLADALKELVNSNDDKESEAYPVINEKTANAVTSVLVSHLEQQLSRLEWALAKLKALSAAGRAGGLRAGQLRLKWEEACYQRLQQLVEALSVLVETRLAQPATCEAVLKAATHMYKALGAAAKAQFAPKGTTQPVPCKAFQELVNTVNRSCTGPLYVFINETHSLNHENDGAAGNVEGEDGDEKAEKKRKRAAATAASRARRESKMVPNLIFAVEDFERQLIRLSKLSKGMPNLMLAAKRSTNRDFKINLEQREGSLGGDGGGGGGSGGGGRQAKRQRDGEQEGEGEELGEGGEEFEPEGMEEGLEV